MKTNTAALFARALRREVRQLRQEEADPVVTCKHDWRYTNENGTKCLSCGAMLEAPAKRQGEVTINLDDHTLRVEIASIIKTGKLEDNTSGVIAEAILDLLRERAK